MADAPDSSPSQDFKKLDDWWVFRSVLASKARFIRSYLSTAATLGELLLIAPYDWDSFRKGERAYDENAVQIAHHPDFLDSETKEAACALVSFGEWRNFVNAFVQWYEELLTINDVARRTGLTGREPVVWRMTFYGSDPANQGVLVQSAVKAPPQYSRRNDYGMRSFIPLPEQKGLPPYPFRRIGDHFEWFKRELGEAATRLEQWAQCVEGKIEQESAALGWQLISGWNESEKIKQEGSPVALPREGAPGPDDLVKLEQAAAFVHRSKRALEQHLGRMPKPYFQGGAGKPSLWKWSDLRPWLEENILLEPPAPPPPRLVTEANPDSAGPPVVEKK
jgi:hypothetical protein